MSKDKNKDSAENFARSAAESEITQDNSKMLSKPLNHTINPETLKLF